MRFTLVTPCFNGVRFIDETILSVVAQAGSFTIRYHVQDGGSTDGTLDKLAHWKALLENGFPLLCGGVEFSYASAPDRGMYSAIKAGFEHCGDGDVMAWINADDRFEPGAFQLVSHVLERFADIDWLSGRITIMDETGTPLLALPIVPFPRQAIAAGVFDGRHWPSFIQQEGSFWRPRLWQAVGGVDAELRLAGDFDLWRRFAGHADLVAVDAVLGCFRRHKSQATSSLTAYHAEIERLLSPADTAKRAAVTSAWADMTSPRALRAAGFTYRAVRRRDSGDWACRRYVALDPDAPLTWRNLPLLLWAARRRLPLDFSFRRLLQRARDARRPGAS